MTIDNAAVIAGEAARILAAYQTNPEAKIPWSDRWTVGTAARHVSTTHHVVAQVIAGRPTGDFGLFRTIEAPAKGDSSFPDWSRAGTAALIEQLTTVPLDEECWSWYADGRTVGFWARRMAQETVVHRWDVEAGTGSSSGPMDPAVAADGVDEFLDVFVATSRGLHAAPAGPSIRFDSTDTSDTWFLRLPEAGQRIVGRDEADFDSTISGPAEGLLLLAWGRLDPASAGVSVSGDTSVIDRWAELVPPM
jgi:uncharacterized protein (TIGR03083 family)